MGKSTLYLKEKSVYISQNKKKPVPKKYFVSKEITVGAGENGTT